MNWSTKTLGEVCEINPRLARDYDLVDESPVSFVPMAAVDEVSGLIRDKQQRSFLDVRKGYTVFRNDDVLFAKITPCMENGKAAIAKDLINGIGFGSTEFHVLRPKADVLPEWVFYFVRRESFRREAKRNFTGTAGQQRVPTTFLANSRIPVPPLDEQRRVVDLLSRAEGIVRLRREAQAKAAEIIPALFLDMFGDPATNPKKWTAATIGDLASYTRYGPRFHDRTYAGDGAHILRTTDMGFAGELSWQQSPKLAVSAEELQRYSLKPGTLLVTRTGATIGKTALFRGATEPCIAGAYLIEVGLLDKVSPDFVLHVLLSSYGQAQLSRGTTTVAQPNINAPAICAIRVPLPPLDAQRSFERHVCAIDSILEQQQRAVTAAQAAFDALIVHAFSGSHAGAVPVTENAVA